MVYLLPSPPPIRVNDRLQLSKGKGDLQQMTDVRPTRANHSLWIVDIIKMVLKAVDEASEVGGTLLMVLWGCDVRGFSSSPNKKIRGVASLGPMGELLTLSHLGTILVPYYGTVF